jgi:EAL domain-containing protein (putative c-di-GMP-specific phosphodiesterase class I)
LFSLDDFGAGMSSFGYLKHLPVDFIKIDGSFVKDVAHDPVAVAMVRAINDVGHVMGKKTIGEFVDGEVVLRALREIGVDFAQGNWISPPSPFPAKRPTATPSVRSGTEFTMRTGSESTHRPEVGTALREIVLNSTT